LAASSEYYWSGGKLHHDKNNLNVVPPIDGLPFINSISTLKTVYSGTGSTTAQYLHTNQTFSPAGETPQCSGGVAAPLLGAETKSVPAPSPPHYGNDVIQLDNIKAKAAIGYLIGGIAADKPYPEITCASNMIFAVTLDPATATPAQLLKKP
jgi:hypothetical protein